MKHSHPSQGSINTEFLWIPGGRKLHTQGSSGEEWSSLLWFLLATVELGHQGVLEADLFSRHYVKEAYPVGIFMYIVGKGENLNFRAHKESFSLWLFLPAVLPWVWS